MDVEATTDRCSERGNIQYFQQGKPSSMGSAAALVASRAQQAKSLAEQMTSP